MTQLELFPSWHSPRTRFEIPAGTASWVEDGTVCRVHVGAHCVDVNWSWWRPWSWTALVVDHLQGGTAWDSSSSSSF